ncbi:phage baseplate assembly protein V [Solirubrobacter soli]|uniref:phage baseplate assembly protein V n=1 Tax=Solirubrobacter soli TaxID=363832 RepID=UPI000408C828|nr:phage baseplate assembly protein V [Solirubrobacter soli]
MNVLHDGSGATSAPRGLVIGTVYDTDDPEGWGRVRVQYPWLSEQALSGWAPIVSPMAGPDYGTWFIPEVGNEAVLAFERGDVDYPFVLGFLWNGQDGAPSVSVRERMIRSVNGHTIRWLDSTPTAGGNRGGIAIEDAHGNSIVLTNGKITIRAAGTLVLDAATIALRSSGVTRVVSPTPNPV